MTNDINISSPLPCFACWKQIQRLEWIFLQGIFYIIEKFLGLVILKGAIGVLFCAVWHGCLGVLLYNFVFILFDIFLTNFGFSWQNACKIGWFSEKESEELFTLANEVCYEIFFRVYIQNFPSNDMAIGNSYLFY